MSQLRPCAACNRHVHTTDAECPFCGTAASVSEAPPRARRVAAGRLTRAAVFAGALAGSAAVAACGNPSPAPANPDNTGHQPQAMPADAGPASTDQADPVGTATADAAVPVERPDPVPDPIPMPYGAPPARDRLV